MEKENKENCGSEDCPDCQTRETIKAVLDRVIQDPTSNLTNSSGVKYDKSAVCNLSVIILTSIRSAP